MDPVTGAVFMIIADGSVDYADAQRKRDALAQHVFPVGLASGYPEVFDSSTIPGLKPGFQVVVVGACATKGDADARLELVRAVAPGAYLREVTAAEACPTIDPTPPGPSSGTVIATYPLATTTKTQLRVRRPPSPANCPNHSLVVDVRLESERLVSTLTVTGDCSEPSDLEVGGKAQWSDPVPVVVDGQTYLAMRVVEEVGSMSTASDYLYGFGCGAWRPVLGPLSIGGDPADAPRLTSRFTPLGGNKVRAQTPEGAKVYTVDPGSCMATL